MESSQDANWHVLWEFAIHIIVGTGIFLTIAIAAICLSLLIHWLEAKQVDQVLVISFKILEYFLFFSDCVLFAMYIIFSVIRDYNSFKNHQ